MRLLHFILENAASQQKAFVFIVIASFANPAYTENVIIADDGSEILLNEDGSWTQLSRDRFGTTRDGQRIRLKPDGSWSVVIDTRLNAYSPDADPKTADTSTMSAATSERASTGQNTLPATKVLLDDAEFLRVTTRSLKSTRIDTRTVFYLSLMNNSQETVVLKNLPLGNFRMKTSGGRALEVLTVTADEQELPPGKRTRITVTADGSPRWSNTRYMSLEIAANTLSNPAKQILSRNLDQIARRELDSF